MIPRFLAAFLLAGTVLLAIVGVLYFQEVHHQQALLREQAEAVLAVKHEFLTREFHAVQSDLLYLARQTPLLRFASGDERQAEVLQREYVNFAIEKGIYDQIRYLNAAGQERIRVNYQQGEASVVPPDELQTKATRYYYRQALSLDAGQVLVSPFDLNVERDEIERPLKPVIRFLTPVYDESGVRQGLLVLNYLGARLLEELAEISEGFAGRTMLINGAGEYLKATDPGRDWGWMLGHDASFRRDFPDAWTRMQGVPQGRIETAGSLLAFRRLDPARRQTAEADRAAPPGIGGGESGGAEVGGAEVGEGDAATLLLVAYVPRGLAAARSRKLLQPLLLLYGGTMFFVGVLSLYWARSSTIHAAQERRLAESEARLRQLSRRLLAAQETERRNLSRDLHDELGQQVTAISLDLKAAARGDVGPHSATRLEHAISATKQLLDSLHAIATRVRPSVLDDLGLRDAVKSFLADYQRRAEVVVHARLNFERPQVPPLIGENVYRILQEALTNVAAHADTRQAWLELDVRPDHLALAVRDRGRGFDAVRALAGSRLGLLGMRERVELLDGSFHLKTAPGQGTEIEVRIPLPDGG